MPKTSKILHLPHCVAFVSLEAAGVLVIVLSKLTKKQKGNWNFVPGRQ